MSSSNEPSSKTSRNSQPSPPRPWIECGIPDGKYHSSPTLTSSTKLPPCASIAVMRAAVKHVGPLGGLVPMQFAHAAGVQPHVHPGDVSGYSELALGHLTGPSAGFEPDMRVREREAQVRQRAVIGRRRHEQVGVLAIPLEVARAGIGAPLTRSNWLRQAILGIRGCSCRCNTAGRDGQHFSTRDCIVAYLLLQRNS